MNISQPILEASVRSNTRNRKNGGQIEQAASFKCPSNTKQNIINLDCLLLSFTMLLLVGLQGQRFHKFQMKYEHVLSKYCSAMKALLVLAPPVIITPTPIIIIPVFISTGITCPEF